MVATWEELGGLALARQFPEVAVTGAAGVGDAVRRTGAVQSQTARSPFLALAARFPGVTHAEITAAYERFEIVRGSTLRGTVHTVAADEHVLLEVATRLGVRTAMQRALRLERTTLEQLWSRLEEVARSEWVAPQVLHETVLEWVATHEDDRPRPQLEATYGRYLGFGHGGLVRRPLKGGWEGQGAPGYRAAAAILPGDRGAQLAAPHALDELVRVHLRAHGPASRHDLAWWSGLGLTVVDEVLGRLDLDGATGPDGRVYLDLPDAPAPREVCGVRLLPEFDALFCAYHPAGRLRFATQEHHDLLWSAANGLVRPPLLVDGRVTGWWRAGGSGRKRPLEVTWFAGTRRPRKGELEEPVAALEAALGITITEVTARRA